MNADLLQFTRDALSKGLDRANIAGLLAQAGWPKADITEALNCFADLNSPVPVPRPRPYLSAQEVFLYLVMFSALYMAIYNVGALLFYLIDVSFPSASSSWHGDTLRWNLSSLIVVAPIFFFTFWIVNRMVAAEPTRRDSKPRKWLTYATLYFTAFSLVIDLGTLVYNFLGGELTENFLFKVLAVAVISGSCFLYFLWDVRKEEKR
jgi:hypothetical protein